MYIIFQRIALHFQRLNKTFIYDLQIDMLPFRKRIIPVTKVLARYGLYSWAGKSQARLYAVPVNHKPVRIRTNKRPKPTKLGKLQDDDNFDFLATKITKGKHRKQVSDVASHKVKPKLEWLNKFNSKSMLRQDERFDRVRHFFSGFATYDSVKALNSDFVSCLKPKLTQFGDMMLKDIIKEDEQLKMVYDDNNPNYAYLLGCIQILEGFDYSAIIRSRMSKNRELLKDMTLYDSFKGLLSKQEEFERTNHGISRLHAVIRAYMALPSPRGIYIESEDYETFLQMIGSHIDELHLNDVEIIYEDVIESGMMLTATELKQWMLSTLKQYRSFNEKNYKQLRLGVESLGYKVIRDHYNMFLSACLNSGNYTLFQTILKDLAQSGFEPDRTTLRLMGDYAGLTNNCNQWLNVMELRMDKYPFMLTCDDYQHLFSSLIGCGTVENRQIAEYILNCLLTIRQAYRDTFKNAIVGKDLDRILEIDNSTKKYFPYEYPLRLFDLVVDQQAAIMIYPRLSTRMFKPFIDTCSSMGELKKILNTMDQNKVVKDLATFHSIFEYMYGNKQVLPYEFFQKLIIDMLNGDVDEYMRYLVEDEYNLRVFVALCQLYTEVGSIDGDNDDVVKSFQYLKHYTTSLQKLDTENEALEMDNQKAIDVDTYKQVVKSILTLVS